MDVQMIPWLIKRKFLHRAFVSIGWGISLFCVILSKDTSSFIVLGYVTCLATFALTKIGACNRCAALAWVAPMLVSIFPVINQRTSIFIDLVTPETIPLLLFIRGLVVSAFVCWIFRGYGLILMILPFKNFVGGSDTDKVLESYPWPWWWLPPTLTMFVYSFVALALAFLTPVR